MEYGGLFCDLPGFSLLPSFLLIFLIKINYLETYFNTKLIQPWVIYVLFCSILYFKTKLINYDFVVRAFSRQGSIVKEPSISVTRVAWSPDGNLLGMVDGDCSPKNVLKIYSCNFK
jgi:hypothetical protein